MLRIPNQLTSRRWSSAFSTGSSTRSSPTTMYQSIAVIHLAQGSAHIERDGHTLPRAIPRRMLAHVKHDPRRRAIGDGEGVVAPGVRPRRGGGEILVHVPAIPLQAHDNIRLERTGVPAHRE